MSEGDVTLIFWQNLRASISQESGRMTRKHSEAMPSCMALAEFFEERGA
ncbi:MULTISPECIES: hypothetical protein [Paraburkholderia]|nr:MULTISPECIES: hypothetical protein [Paraburkholderia]